MGVHRRRLLYSHPFNKKWRRTAVGAFSKTASRTLEPPEGIPVSQHRAIINFGNDDPESL